MTTRPSPARPPFGARILSLALACASVPAIPAAAPLHAQQVVQEVQVPLDPERGILEIGAELRRDLDLFPDIDDFVSARLFEAPDGTRVLEISRRGDAGRIVRERRVVSDAELAELRGRIAAGLEARGMGRAVATEGRGGVVLAETVLGLLFYGWAVPEVLGIESDRGELAAYLLTAGASFYVPYRITRSIPVTDAHRDAVVWGATRGIVYGLLVGDALTMGDDDEIGRDFGDADDDSRVVVGLGMATSIAGSFLGYRAVDPARHDRGDVALWSTGGDFALGYGFGIATALGLYGGETRCEVNFCVEDDFEFTTAGHLATTAIGLAGIHGARKWAEAEDYTVGDARALLSFGVLGGQLALPLAWAVFEDMDGGEKGLAASLVAGSAAGLWWGNRALRPRTLSDGDGLLVQAGHLAGGAVAGGLTYLIDDGRSDELLYLTTIGLGSAAGALLTFRAVAGGRGDTGVGAGAEAGARSGGPTVEIAPAGLWAPLIGRDSPRRTRVPVVTIRH